MVAELDATGQQARQSGPLGANSMPATVTQPGDHTMPFNPLKDVALEVPDEPGELPQV